MNRGLLSVQLGSAFLSLVALQGCMTMSSMQTARSLPVGEGEVRLETGYMKSQIGTDDSKETMTLPYFGGGYRRGIVEKLEAGVSYVFPGTLRADAKYQFYNAPELAMASGLGVDYTDFSIGDNKYTIADISVPLYMSYDMADWASVYLNPKGTLRVYSSSVEEEKKQADGTSKTETVKSNSTQTLVGGSFGIKIGKSGGVIPEVTYMANLSEPDNSYLGFGLGIFF
jgi:hypothetical protein